MKKRLFIFALVGMAVTMMSCTGKTAKDTEAQDSTAIVKEQSAVVKTIDQKTYSLGLPKGWVTMSAGDTECMVFKGSASKPSEAIDGVWVALNTTTVEAKGMNLELAIKAMLKEMGAKQLEDVTIGGTTYKQCSYTEKGVESRILMAGKDKLVSFMMSRTTPDDPDVRAIISSLKLK